MKNHLCALPSIEVRVDESSDGINCVLIVNPPHARLSNGFDGVRIVGWIVVLNELELGVGERLVGFGEVIANVFHHSLDTVEVEICDIATAVSSVLPTVLAELYSLMPDVRNRTVTHFAANELVVKTRMNNADSSHRQQPNDNCGDNHR